MRTIVGSGWREAVGRESELLVCCARLQLDPVRAARVRQLVAGGLRWGQLGELGDVHGLIPLLYRHLSETAADVVPAAELEALREQYVSNAAHNLRLAAELREILALLSADGISALPFKGPVLAQQLYGSLALRQITDLDVLVRRADVVRARAVLIAHGYRSPRSRLAIPGTLHFEYQHRLEHARDDIVVELHWTLAPRSVAAAPSMEELWERRETVTLLGDSVPAIGGGDLLLALCIHGSKHRWCRLEWITSVAELLARSAAALDWDSVVGHSKRLGDLRMLRLGIGLAHDVLDAPVPAAVLESVRADTGARALAASVADHLFAATSGANGLLSDTAGGFVLRAKERLVDRVRYVYFSRLTSAIRMAGQLAGRLGASSEP